MENPLERYMHQLIVLGNGFDLAQGLKTGYADYFSAKYGDKPAIGEIDNAWDMVLFCRKSDNNNNWSNVEEAIRDQIAEMGFVDKVIKELDRTRGLPVNNSLESHLASRIVQKNGDMHAKSSDKLSRNYKKSLYLNFMREELTSFEISLSHYLKRVIEDCTDEAPMRYLISSDALYESIAGMPAFSDASTLEQQHNTILTFNYTSPFQQRDKGYFPGVDSIRFVHGSLSAGDIIIGIDALNYDEEGNRLLIDDEDTIPFTKTFRTLQSTSHVDTLPDTFDDIPFDCIKFFGHSLSEADYSYFQSIFDHVNLYSSDTALMFLYRPDSRYDGSDLYLKVTKLINKYGDTLDNKDHGKNLLHKLILENRLSIKRIY